MIEKDFLPKSPTDRDLPWLAHRSIAYYLRQDQPTSEPTKRKGRSDKSKLPQTKLTLYLQAAACPMPPMETWPAGARGVAVPQPPRSSKNSG